MSQLFHVFCKVLFMYHSFGKLCFSNDFRENNCLLFVMLMIRILEGLSSVFEDTPTNPL